MSQSCSSCRYWAPNLAPNTEFEDGKGNCYRYPPTHFVTGTPPSHETSLFPVTSDADWCGEYVETFIDVKEKSRT